MSITRRALLKGLAGASAGVAAAPVTALAKEQKRRPDDAVGLLYDATRCIGCKACMSACREANGLEADARDGTWYDPKGLNAYAKNVITFYPGEQGTQPSFMKLQCMHCVDPACASVCMLGALHKGPKGIVEYDVNSCIGCRYCEIACPFNVPAFEWHKAVPKIVKCELCRNRGDGKAGVPACAEVCPRAAVISGTYKQLIAEGKRRIAAEPDKYQPKVYGESDGGGTQVLYLSAATVPFEKLGLPNLGEKSVPSMPETIQHAIYKGFIAPVALYGALGAVIFRNRKKNEAGEEAES
jgi:Fe-S-cluster-containing dehydrogenase component